MVTARHRSVELSTWYLVAQPVYCKDGASDFHRGAKRENPIKSGGLTVFDINTGEVKRAFRAILTLPGGKIFRARRFFALIDESRSLISQRRHRVLSCRAAR